MRENDFFHLDDPHALEVEGIPIPSSYWSRLYEYPWAIRFAQPNTTVADFGAGERPFKYALAKRCGTVYAIDGREFPELPDCPPNLINVKCDLREIKLADHSIDMGFCISVLEKCDLREIKSAGQPVDTGCRTSGPEEIQDYRPILKEFKRVIRPGGIIVTTFDVQYALNKPLGRFRAIALEHFEDNAAAEGLLYLGTIANNRRNAVVHQEYNLCVFHCLLRSV